jgi:hypothetical protein
MKKDFNVKLERIYEKRVTFFGNQVRIKRLILISLICVIFGLTGYSGSSNNSWLIFTIVCSTFFISFFILFQKSILYFGEYSIEVSASGDIFVTKLHGHCSLCDGHIKVEKSKKGSFLRCTKNPKHYWNMNEKT